MGKDGVTISSLWAFDQDLAAKIGRLDYEVGPSGTRRGEVAGLHVLAPAARLAPATIVSGGRKDGGSHGLGILGHSPPPPLQLPPAGRPPHACASACSAPTPAACACCCWPLALLEWSTATSVRTPWGSKGLPPQHCWCRSELCVSFSFSRKQIESRSFCRSPLGSYAQAPLPSTCTALSSPMAPPRTRRLCTELDP